MTASTLRKFPLAICFAAALALLIPATSKAGSHDGMDVGIWLNRHVMAEGKDAIVEFLDKAEAHGINVIFPNYWFHGYVIYPGSRHVQQHPDFIGSDPMAIVVREAKARGMEVHPWGEYGFFTHYNFTDDQEDVGYVLKRYPEWITENLEGRVALHNERAGWSHYSLNPGHPGARRFLADVLLEVIELYPEVDGLHLDRIRYQNPDFSYDDYSIEAFEAIHGVDPREAAPDNPDSHAPWVRFREDQINKFMTLLTEDLRREHPEIVLTGAVVPPYMMHEKFQRWDEWAHRGQIDVLIPMMYGGPQLVRRELAASRAMLPANQTLWGGLDAHAGTDALALSLDTLAANGVSGVVIWDDMAFLQQEFDFTPWREGTRDLSDVEVIEGEVEERPDLY